MDVFPSKTLENVENVTDISSLVQMPPEVVFSDIFEVSLADRTKVRGCFALWKRTRHILSLAFDYRMQADLVVSTIEQMHFDVPGSIFHSDQGSQYGAAPTRAALLQKGFLRSMSRAGTPTDNGYAERFVLAQGEQVIPIPGTKHARYLDENLGALDIALSQADLQELSQLPPRRRNSLLSDRRAGEGTDQVSFLSPDFACFFLVYGLSKTQKGHE